MRYEGPFLSPQPGRFPPVPGTWRIPSATAISSPITMSVLNKGACGRVYAVEMYILSVLLAVSAQGTISRDAQSSPFMCICSLLWI